MKPYVFSNRLKLGPNDTLGTFSSHGAAFVALCVLHPEGHGPDWTEGHGPDWTEADQQELDRVRALLTAPSPAANLPAIHTK